MQIDSHNSIIVRLLISPRWRVIRHLILFLFVFFISIGLISFGDDRGEPLGDFWKLAGLLFYTFLFLGGCYLTIYVFTPRFLLKDKWGVYFASLLGLVFLMLVFIVLFQVISEKGGDAPVENQVINSFYFFRTIINILSISLSFFMLFAGLSAFVLFKNWILDMRQAEELESVTLQMELKLLENQINPHFLFNMLNNANIMVRKDPEVAIHIISKLEEMLRYLMNESVNKRVRLKDELAFLSDFLELEKTRRDYFDYTISSEGNMDQVEIVPLLFIPFVENAVKHSQDSKTGSYVYLVFHVEKDKLIFVCENSIPLHTTNKKDVGGIGLANVKRRLDLLHKGNYVLENTKTDTNYIVKLELKL